MKTKNYIILSLICIGLIFSCSKDSSDDNIISQVQSNQTNTTSDTTDTTSSSSSTGTTTTGTTTTGTTTTQVSSFDRGTILVNYADNIIIPRHNDFKIALNELKTATDNFTEAPSIANYDLLHEKWVESYKKWQYIEMFNIGKAEEIMFYNKVNTYPASTDRINNNIDENKTDLSNPNDWSAQGFPGIDYMIHGIESTKQAIVDKYNTKKVIYFTLAPLFFGILALIFFESYFFMMLYMSLLGLSLGIGTPFIGSLWAELYGLESLGSVKALLHALGVFFSALSPVVFGYMIDFGMGVLSISFMSLFIIIFSTVLPFFYNQN